MNDEPNQEVGKSLSWQSTPIVIIAMGNRIFKNHSSVLLEDEIGGVATSTDSNARDRSLEGDDGTDGMEFDGGGEASPTS